MYDCGEEVRELFHKNYRQVARITVYEKNGNTFQIDESDIPQGGLTIDRYSMSGSLIELGSAIAAELNLKLKNTDGKYDNVSFEGAELFVEIGIKKWDAHRWEKAVIHYIPCGYFIINTPPRTLSTIHIIALDRMVKFDKYVDWSEFTFPLRISRLIYHVCEICDVELSSTVYNSPNARYYIPEAPKTEGLTYRTLIQWCAFLLGTCAYMDYNGKLVFKWYEDTELTLAPSDRYSSDIYEEDISITGLKYTASNNGEFSFGLDDYSISYVGCDILQDDVNIVLNNIFNDIDGFTYRPFEANVKPMPYLYPLDGISFMDKNNDLIYTIISHITFTLNGRTTIAAKGKTGTNNNYATPIGITPQQMIHDAAATGLYKTEEVKNDGSIIYYLHDYPSISSSHLIITITKNGIAISNDGGETTAFSFDFVTGDAIANTISGNAAWITELFAQNITASGTITGLNLLGSRLETSTYQDSKVEIEGDNVIAHRTDDSHKVKFNSRQLIIETEELSHSGNDKGILLSDLDYADAGDTFQGARITTVPITPINPLLHTGLAPAIQYQGKGSEGANYSGKLLRIPEITTGSITISSSDYNQPVRVDYWDDNGNFLNIPVVTLSHTYLGNSMFQGDIEITSVSTNCFFVQVNATASDTDDMVIYWTAIH